MSNNPGTLLAEAIKELSKVIGATVNTDGMVSKESMSAILRGVVEDFNKTMAEEVSSVSPGALDVLLLSLANYSLLERKIMEGGGVNLDNEVRKSVLDRAFFIMKTGKIPEKPQK